MSTHSLLAAGKRASGPILSSAKSVAKNLSKQFHTGAPNSVSLTFDLAAHQNSSSLLREFEVALEEVGLKGRSLLEDLVDVSRAVVRDAMSTSSPAKTTIKEPLICKMSNAASALIGADKAVAKVAVPFHTCNIFQPHAAGLTSVAVESVTEGVHQIALIATGVLATAAVASATDNTAPLGNCRGLYESKIIAPEALGVAGGGGGGSSQEPLIVVPPISHSRKNSNAEPAYSKEAITKQEEKTKAFATIADNLDDSGYDLEQDLNPFTSDVFLSPGRLSAAANDYDISSGGENQLGPDDDGYHESGGTAILSSVSDMDGMEPIDWSSVSEATPPKSTHQDVIGKTVDFVKQSLGLEYESSLMVS